MEQYLPVIRSSQIFNGLGDDEILSVLRCTNSYIRNYSKGDFITDSNYRISEISIILSGHVCLITEDYEGNRNIISKLSPGQLFGETFACLGIKPVTISAVADDKCRILFLNIKRLTTVCENAHAFHNQIIQNLLYILSAKNLALTDRIKHTSKRTIRYKLLSYLSDQYHLADSEYFEIPFSRQQLADYLSLDRSALSAELCKMRDEGILEFNRNKFHFLKSST